MHWSRGYNALLRCLIMQWSCIYHVLATWLIMHLSRDWSCTDHVTDHALITWRTPRKTMTSKCFAVKQWLEMTHVLAGKVKLSSYRGSVSTYMTAIAWDPLDYLPWAGMKKVLGDLVTTHLSFLPQPESLKATAEGKGHSRITPLASVLAAHHSYLS